jgi:hypothetical protein
VWTRPRAALIAGEPLQPLDRALLIADSANGISRELSMEEWLFVPPSLSLQAGDVVILAVRWSALHEVLRLSRHCLLSVYSRSQSTLLEAPPPPRPRTNRPSGLSVR